MTEVQTQAPIAPGTTPGLAATIALGRLLRLYPTADITSIRFTVEGSGNPYGDDGPYVHAKAQLVPGAHLVASEAFVVPDDEPEFTRGWCSAVGGRHLDGCTTTRCAGRAE